MNFDFSIPITWSDIISFLSTLAALGAVVAAVVANSKSNEALNYSLKMQEQSKNVDLYDRRIAIYEDIKGGKKVSDISVKMLFDEKITDSYEQMKALRATERGFERDKKQSEHFAKEIIREKGLNEDFLREILTFQSKMAMHDCPENVFEEYEAYCKQYEVSHSFTGFKEDYKTYNYSECERKQNEYMSLANNEQKKLLDLIEEFIKLSISPVNRAE